ncbi:MAG: DUF2141 domain-containing protein [Psychroserpens sp.]|uniref:DUF2141 domain-containing protein n=1 Tax=Psychroserpens sp. TaxID=2020870 RepID=UPI003CA5282F
MTSTSQNTINNSKTTITKIFILSLVLTLITSFGFAQDKKGVTITVTVENFLSDEGKAGVALHTYQTFMKSNGLQNIDSKIVDGKATFVFENVLPGNYALLALHDKNENGRMDFENGMPTEAYGTSNNSRGYGPPSYESSKFTVEKEDLEISIRL